MTVEGARERGRASEPGAHEPEGHTITVRRPGAGASAWPALALAAALVALGLAVGGLGRPGPLAQLGGVALVLAGLVLGPALALRRRLRAEADRLRAALACPYCKDALPTDEALACDRTGCGAFYHPECWAECRASYGGCAIYGCGGTSGHRVGRFALRRHVLRLLLAAAFFPPRVVKRLQEHERQGLRDLWRQARRLQEGVTLNEGWTCFSAFVNAGVSVSLTIALVVAKELDLLSEGTLAALILPLLVLPVVMIRLPLLATFGWGALRLVARAFRDELAALGRADEGTFLARLAGGAGKKEG